MIEQQGNALTFYAFFTATKQGKTGLTVTADTYRNGSLVGSGGNAATEVGGGLYRYTLASGAVNAEGEYVTIFKTADASVDQQHVPSLWVVQKAGVEHLDADVSSRTSGSLADLDATVSSRATPAQVESAVAAVSGGGGSVQDTVEVKDDADHPLDGVLVIVTTGAAGPADDVVASGMTDAFGTATFMLDPGTYYVWKQFSGFNFTNPQTWTVSA